MKEWWWWWLGAAAKMVCLCRCLLEAGRRSGSFEAIRRSRKGQSCGSLADDEVNGHQPPLRPPK